jgi:hypothetical protein
MPQAKVSAGSILQRFKQLHSFMGQGHLMKSLIIREKEVSFPTEQQKEHKK